MTIQSVLQEKKAWFALQARVKALPKDYIIVYKEMQKYLFKIGGADFEGLIELFEESAAAGRDVLEVTGRDVAAFCDDLAKSGPYYQYLLDAQEKANLKAVEATAKYYEKSK
jgi:DNA-binding ferritin-like protein (Dps family)